MGNNKVIVRLGNIYQINSVQIFLILILLVLIIQFSLLNLILKNGFTADDWLLLFDYKTIGSNGDILEKIYSVFHAKGIYTTYQVLYIGILEIIFKGNYSAYQITNIIFKILATLSLYPLILIVFKRKLLAFLSTVLYSLSFSSSGALQFVVKGSDYLAILLMNICLIMYYFTFKRKRKYFLLFTAILLFFAFIFSPIRIYPFLLFVILFEVFIWLKSKGIFGLITAFLRLCIIFSFFIILLLFLPQSTGNFFAGPLVVYKLLSYGNYQLLLTPFAGFGYTFLPNEYWQIFGQVTFDSFREYLLFLFRGPIIIYSFLTIILGFLITKKPYFFIAGVIFANVVFEIATYFFVTNLKGVVGPNVKGFYPISTYAAFFGFFCLSAAVSSLIIWLSNHRLNILLLSFFTGPIFASIFLWGTWLIIGDSLTFKEGIHWYLIIPPIGTSLFLASLMVLVFDKVMKVVSPYPRYALITYLFLIIFPIYLISSKEINSTFSYLLHIGYGATDQEHIKDKLLSHLKNPLDVKHALFYLDTSEELRNPLFYPVTLISGFNEKIHFRDWEIINGCTGLIYDRATLEKSVVVKDGVLGFQTSSLCVENYKAVGRQEIFYEQENFYAFKLKDQDVIDIKEQILSGLGFK